VSCMSNVGQDVQPTASQQVDSGLIPLVIDLEEVCETSSAVAFVGEATMSVTQAVDQPTQNLSGAAQSHVQVPESAVTTDVTAMTDSDTNDAAFDLTVSRPPRPADAVVSAADDSVVFISQTPAMSTALSDEYRARYDKYENLCALITLKDRELTELNEERKKLHQLLVELQRAILTRPSATADTAPAPPTAADKDRDKERTESRQERAEMSAATAAYRRRPAHRGVTSVRVMVKSTQPPTAHSTKINLLRYNSLFCNYDDAAVARRKPSTEVVAASDDAVSSIHATDLTAQHTSANRTGPLDEGSLQLPASAETSDEQTCPTEDVTAPILHVSGENRSDDVDGGYVNEARSTSHGRLELVQCQRHPLDDGQTSSVADLCFSAAVQNTAAVNTAAGPPGAHTVADDGQRAARQIADAARHQQFVVATASEMILSTAGVSRRDFDDQPAVVLSSVRPEMSLMMSSPGKRRFAGADVELPARSIAGRPELRPPPPYPRRCLENPHTYSVTAPQLSPSVQMSRTQPDHSAATAAYIYRKENSAGPRTGYVQPMRVDNQAMAVLPSSSACAVREMDANRQPFSDISVRGQLAGEAVLLGSRMSPPAIPLRVGPPVRTANDQVYYHLQHATSDMPQPQPRNYTSYHGNRLSNPQSSRSDAVRHALAPNVEQRHVTMTSSSERDDVSRYPVEPRPLDQLQHFVGGPAQMQAVDVGDPRLRRSSPVSPCRMLTSVDGRMHVADFTRHDMAPVALHVRDCLATTEADLPRRAASYQAGHSPRFPTAACAPPPPPPPSLRRDPTPLQAQRAPRPGPPHAGPAAAPLDMSGAKHRRYAPLNQVSTRKKTVVIIQ